MGKILYFVIVTNGESGAARWKFQGKGPQLLLSQTWEIWCKPRRKEGLLLITSVEWKSLKSHPRTTYLIENTGSPFTLKPFFVFSRTTYLIENTSSPFTFKPFFVFLRLMFEYRSHFALWGPPLIVVTVSFSEKRQSSKCNCEILLMLKYLIGPCWFTSHSKDATKSRPFLSLQHHSYPKCK